MFIIMFADLLLQMIITINALYELKDQNVIGYQLGKVNMHFSNLISSKDLSRSSKTSFTPTFQCKLVIIFRVY